MNWNTVEATCDCTDLLHTWSAFVTDYDVDDLDRAKEMIDGRVEQHLEESEHCSEETVERKIYGSKEW
jgi:hypothetical protein